MSVGCCVLNYLSCVVMIFFHPNTNNYRYIITIISMLVRFVMQFVTNDNCCIPYYNQVIDYDYPVIDYYNPLLRFKPCLNPLGLVFIRFPSRVNVVASTSSSICN